MEEVREALLAQQICTNVTVERGGLSTDRGPAFVKFGTGGADASVEMLNVEAMGLEHMSRWCQNGDGTRANVLVPKPWLVGQARGGGALRTHRHLKLL